MRAPQPQRPAPRAGGPAAKFGRRKGDLLADLEDREAYIKRVKMTDDEVRTPIGGWHGDSMYVLTAKGEGYVQSNWQVPCGEN